MSYSTKLGLSNPDGKRLIADCLEEYERAGLIMRTGEYRKARDGRLEPVYTATEAFKRQLGMKAPRG
jgi:hypothetical protein